MSDVVSPFNLSHLSNEELIEYAILADNGKSSPCPIYAKYLDSTDPSLPSIAKHSWLMSALCFGLPSTINGQELSMLRSITLSIVYGMKQVSEELCRDDPAKGFSEELKEGKSMESQIIPEIDQIAMLLWFTPETRKVYYDRIVGSLVHLKDWAQDILLELELTPGPTTAFELGHRREWSLNSALDSRLGLQRPVKPHERLAVFARVVAYLPKVSRQGWIRHGITDPESVADHSWSMAVLRFPLSKIGIMDFLHSVAMLVVHDGAETLVGDIAPGDNIKKETKAVWEKSVVTFLQSLVPDKPLLKLAWDAFEYGKSLTSLVAHELDKLDMVIKALLYEKKHKKELPEFFQTVRGRAEASSDEPHRKMNVQDPEHPEQPEGLLPVPPGYQVPIERSLWDVPASFTSASWQNGVSDISCHPPGISFSAAESSPQSGWLAHMGSMEAFTNSSTNGEMHGVDSTVLWQLQQLCQGQQMPDVPSNQYMTEAPTSDSLTSQALDHQWLEGYEAPNSSGFQATVDPSNFGNLPQPPESVRGEWGLDNSWIRTSASPHDEDTLDVPAQHALALSASCDRARMLGLAVTPQEPSVMYSDRSPGGIHQPLQNTAINGLYQFDSTLSIYQPCYDAWASLSANTSHDYQPAAPFPHKALLGESRSPAQQETLPLMDGRALTFREAPIPPNFLQQPTKAQKSPAATCADNLASLHDPVVASHPLPIPGEYDCSSTNTDLERIGYEWYNFNNRNNDQLPLPPSSGPIPPQQQEHRMVSTPGTTFPLRSKPSAFMCIRVRPVDLPQFRKWSDLDYERRFTGVKRLASSLNGVRRVTLRHYNTGPGIPVDCGEFEPESSRHYQYHALKKNWAGWHVVKTTSYCLATELSVDDYLDDCVGLATAEACSGQTPVKVFMELARANQNTKLIKECLKMFTALRLLRIGWQFSGDETLGMTLNTDENSPFSGKVPVPRMLQNQLNRLLEKALEKSEIFVTEKLQSIYRTHKQDMWFLGSLASFLLVHVRELDAGRLVYWKHHPDERGFWIHPWQPSALMQEAVASCQCLVQHYRSTLGLKQLSIDWDTPEAKKSLGYNKTRLSEMKQFQKGVAAI
ncbi:hypothetical protein FSARC_13861, partial [Fusarium sarcochroum]